MTSGCSSVTANVGSNVTAAPTRPVRGRPGEQTVSNNQRPSPPPSTVDLASTGTSDSDDIDTSLASSRCVCEVAYGLYHNCVAVAAVMLDRERRV
jgi:hypothetical protein